jgi:wobble nucleotide-excising tRNase
MIESVKIANVATYAEPQTMAGLGRLNFIFGANGAGKTTIGRVLAQQPGHEHCAVAWKNGAPLRTLVYNRDFVDSNFNASSDLKGIFTLGKDGIDNEAAITTKKTEVAQINENITQLKRTLGNNGDNAGKTGDATEKTGKYDELDKLTSAFQDRCWDWKQKRDEAFKVAFTGVRDSRAKFKDKVLAQSAVNQAGTRALEELIVRAKTVFGPPPQTEQSIQALGGTDLVDLEASEILGKKVVGKADVNIAAMIHRLGHSDWVKEGQGYFAESAPSCPFCQQRAPIDFEKTLSAYFDETFALDIAAIADLQTSYDAKSKTMLTRLQSAFDVNCRFLDKAAFEAEKATIEAKMRASALILANKRKEPSSTQALESLAAPLAAAAKLIETANQAVAEHNRIVANLTAEKSKLTDEVWRHILSVDLKDDLPNYLSAKKALDAAIASLSQQIRDAGASKKVAEAELGALERAATSVQPTVDAINGMLKSFGFKTFSLARVDDGPRYKLVRQDGKDARHSLSDGEKSFVTFLYFYHLIKGSESESGITSDRVAVFDDPVSSLDSEVLFIVSSLIRALFDDMRNDRGQIKQIFVLTHNVYFHKEVCFNAGKPPKGKDKSKSGKDVQKSLKPTYWVVRKDAAGPRLEFYDKNPINTSYDLLWKEIGRDAPNPLTIQNTMRRILEHYFKILGGVDFDDLCEKFEGQDKIVCHSLLSWVNDGSHYSHDDAHYAFGDDVVAAQLVIFKKIFEKTNHMPHYDMMIERA